jgi:hypothetical protein
MFTDIEAAINEKFDKAARYYKKENVRIHLVDLSMCASWVSKFSQKEITDYIHDNVGIKYVIYRGITGVVERLVGKNVAKSIPSIQEEKPCRRCGRMNNVGAPVCYSLNCGIKNP